MKMDIVKPIPPQQPGAKQVFPVQIQWHPADAQQHGRDAGQNDANRLANEQPHENPDPVGAGDKRKHPLLDDNARIGQRKQRHDAKGNRPLQPAFEPMGRRSLILAFFP